MPNNMIYVELYGTLSEKDFVAAILASLNQIESKLEKLVKLVRNALRSVKLGMSIDPITGSPGISVSFDSGYDEAMLRNVLGLLPCATIINAQRRQLQMHKNR